MALYYYDKFTAIANTYPPTYSYTVEWGAETEARGQPTADGYSSYTLDSDTGIFSVAGSRAGIVAANPGTVYNGGGSSMNRYTSNGGGYIWVSTATAKKTQTGGGGTYYTKGSLVQSDIVAEDGTYPANGRHSDGSWYVRGAAVPGKPGVITQETNMMTINQTSKKLVRLDNGWLLSAAVYQNAYAKIYLSKDNGITWTDKGSLSNSAMKDIALVSTGNNAVVAFIYNNLIDMRTWNSATEKLSNDAIVEVQPRTTIVYSGVSLFYDKASNTTHFTWLSQQSSSSYVVYHSKSTDGGKTWSRGVMLPNPAVLLNYPNVVVYGSAIYVFAVYKQPGNNTQIVRAKSTDNGATFTGWTSLYSTPYSCDNLHVIVDKNGRFHFAWYGTEQANMSNHSFYRYSDNQGDTWLESKTPILPSNNIIYPALTSDKNGNLYIFGHAGANLSVYVSNDSGKAWSNPATIVTNGQHAQPLFDSTWTISFSGKADTPPPFIYTHDVPKYIEYLGSYSLNSAPSITIVSPTDNQTLYENDTMNISGDAYDSDKDQAVTAYYQINSEPRKVLATNVSQTQISLTKQLKFKSGKLYDGDTAITGNLTDGVAHKLKVWAVDSENASSPVVERTFYVVPNRAPLISVDDVVLSGVVDNDKFKISGTATDLDDNSTIKVTRRINSGNSVEIYSGPGGAWEFDIALAQLQVGENVILVEVIDNYGAKTSKTIKLNKNEVKTPILQSVARYKIEPPKGTAKGVLLFIERDKELDLRVELSMTLNGEQEQYETLTPEDTAQMPYNDSIVEDTFYYETTEAKDNIILKLTSARPDATVNHKIHLISGAVE